MLPVIVVLLAFVASLFRSRTSLRLENLALRHQLAVYKQTVARPRLTPTDRLFWACLPRLWPVWQDTLHFVQPRTVMAWQRQWFRDHWRRLSQQGKCGRPMIAKEVRALIQTMWQANPTIQWTAPQVGEAFPWDETPRYLLRDRIYGTTCRQYIKHMGIKEVVIAPSELSIH